MVALGIKLFSFSVREKQ